MGNTSGNLLNGGFFSEYDNRIYFSNRMDDGALYSMNMDFKDFKKISNDKAGYINAAGKYLYYLSMNYSKNKTDGDVFSFKNTGIYRINLDGSHSVNLHDDPGGLINLYGNSLYYQYYNSKEGLKFYKVDIDGKNNAKLSDSPIIPLSIKEDLLYYSGTSNHAIYTMDLSTGMTNLLSRTKAYAPILQEKYIYYMSLEHNYAIYRMKADGTNPEEIISERCSTYNITPDGRYLYYQVDDTQNNSIRCMNLDTLETQTLMEGDFKNIHIVGGKVIFTDFNETVQYYAPIGLQKLILEFNPDKIAK
jgi:hypothetical protein